MLLGCYSKYINIKKQLAKRRRIWVLELRAISNWCIWFWLIFQWNLFLLIHDKSVSHHIRPSGLSFDNCTSRNHIQFKFWDWKLSLKIPEFFVCLSVTVLKSHELLLAATTMENTLFLLKASFSWNCMSSEQKKNYLEASTRSSDLII